MKSTQNRPIIGITMGDPLGIGPEILVKALSDPKIYRLCRPLVIGDANIIKKALHLLSLPIKINLVDKPSKGIYEHNTLDIMNISDLNQSTADLKKPSIQTGKAMENYILTGVNLALDKEIKAIVTCPITKTGLKLAKSRFHGHTELIADKTKTKKFAMMLAGSRLKVVLVTIHIPLSQVSQSLTIDNISQTIRLTQSSLTERFGIQNPRLAAAGLNPHAGEESMFGSEEQNIIEPALLKARQEGIDIDGPLPPDTIFYRAVNGRYDAVICMYHDQGLIPFKMVHFKDGVNTTLGLPIIRTSVDHGTAYDIAWKGIADPSSLVAAIGMAVLQANTAAGTRTETRIDK